MWHKLHEWSVIWKLGWCRQVLWRELACKTLPWLLVPPSTSRIHFRLASSYWHFVEYRRMPDNSSNEEITYMSCSPKHSFYTGDWPKPCLWNVLCHVLRMMHLQRENCSWPEPKRAMQVHVCCARSTCQTQWSEGIDIAWDNCTSICTACSCIASYKQWCIPSPMQCVAEADGQMGLERKLIWWLVWPPAGRATGTRHRLWAQSCQHRLLPCKFHSAAYNVWRQLSGAPIQCQHCPKPATRKYAALGSAAFRVADNWHCTRPGPILFSGAQDCASQPCLGSLHVSQHF